MAKRGFMDCYQRDPNGPGDPGQWQRAFRFRLGIDAARAAVGEKNPRSILEVGEIATWDEIKRAYRKMAMRHHPDRGGDAAAFRRIQGAFEILEAQYGVL